MVLTARDDYPSWCFSFDLYMRDDMTTIFINFFKNNNNKEGEVLRGFPFFL